MKFLSVLLSTLAITTSTMAAPGTDANEAGQTAQANNWECCASGFTVFHLEIPLHSQTECRMLIDVLVIVR